MSDYPVSACASCQAPVIWVLTAATESRMPVNAEPNPSGNLELALLGPIGQPWVQATVVPRIQRQGRSDLHLSHFVTCPNAKRHRRGGRRAANVRGRR